MKEAPVIPGLFLLLKLAVGQASNGTGINSNTSIE